MNIELAAECLVAVTGLYPSKPVSDGEAREAMRLPKDTADAVAAFMDGKGPRRSGTAHIDYLKAWKRLNSKVLDVTIASEIEDQRVADAYLAKLREARAYLKDQWRPVQVLGLLGNELMQAPLSEMQRCSDLWAIVNDPRTLHSRMSVGCIMAEEIAALRAVFPEFVAMVDTMLDAQMFQRRKARKSYEVPYRQEVAIRMFRGMPTGAPMEVINPDAQAPQAQPPQIKIGVNSDKTDKMTRADRVGGDVPAQ